MEPLKIAGVGPSSVDEELPDALEEAAVYGGLRLRSFDEVMAAYEDCLVQKLRS